MAGMSRFRMIVVCLALLLEGMSASGINVQLLALRAELGVPDAELQTVAGAFLIAYAGLLPIAGTLADRLDRRRVFLIGIACFGLGCIICAAAPSAAVLVAGRLVQGAGAALSAPAALALITDGLPEGAARNRAVALYGAMGAVGFSLGLVVPGAVVTWAGWRWSFLFSVPVVLLVLAASWRIRATRSAVAGRPDAFGALLLTAALMLGIHLVGAVGSLPTGVLAIEGAVLAVLVGALVLRGGVRGFPRRVADDARVRAACLGLAGVFAAVMGSMFVLSLALGGTGASALAVALLILPQPIAFSSLSGLGARLVTRAGPVRVFTAGALVLAASLAWLAVTGIHAPVWAGVLPAMAGVGVSLALCFPAASVAAVDAAPPECRATTAGLLTTAQNVGGALGIALLTALGTVPAAADPEPALAPAMTASAVLAVVGLTAAGAVLALARGAARERPRHAVSPSDV